MLTFAIPYTDDISTHLFPILFLLVLLGFGLTFCIFWDQTDLFRTQPLNWLAPLSFIWCLPFWFALSLTLMSLLQTCPQACYGRKISSKHCCHFDLLLSC